MKKIYLICSIILLLLFFATTGILATVSSYTEISKLCDDIKSNKTEEALVKIKKINNVNKGTAPELLRPFLNMLEYEIELPLIVACQEGNAEVVKVLLERGADPNKAYKKGFTAAESVFSANSHNELEILKLLVDYGGDVSKSESGNSPLFEAAQKMIYASDVNRKSEFAECVKFLLMYDSNLIDDKGYTILHYAVMAENLELTEYLIKTENQLLNYVNDYGETALSIAIDKDNQEIIKILKDNTGDENK